MKNVRVIIAGRDGFDMDKIVPVREEHKRLQPIELQVSINEHVEALTYIIDEILTKQLMRIPSEEDYAKTIKLVTPAFSYGWYIIHHYRLLGTLKIPKRGDRISFIPYEMVNGE